MKNKFFHSLALCACMRPFTSLPALLSCRKQTRPACVDDDEANDNRASKLLLLHAKENGICNFSFCRTHKKRVLYYYILKESVTEEVVVNKTNNILI